MCIPHHPDPPVCLFCTAQNTTNLELQFYTIVDLNNIYKGDCFRDFWKLKNIDFEYSDKRAPCSLGSKRGFRQEVLLTNKLLKHIAYMLERMYQETTKYKTESNATKTGQITIAISMSNKKAQKHNKLRDHLKHHKILVIIRRCQV